MWPDMVEFRSVNLEIRRRKKEDRRKKESLVKYKSTDNYMSGGVIIPVLNLSRQDVYHRLQLNHSAENPTSRHRVLPEITNSLEAPTVQRNY